ncbi:hypothetical protein [Sphingomonas aracearum]|uniref:F0F1 ATP synthase subunit B family protein n=1 Tax=Sphingomonas aracearum TaxID=2283317 RepID=UPI0015F06B6B|nr:hypothetical protein [Sphingomonas aracearum]
MHFDGWTLALQTINVLVLVWLLKRFLFRPVADMIAARQAAAETLLADAEAARAEAAARATALKAQNDAFAAEAVERRAAMQAGVEADRARLLAQAKEAAEALSRQAQAASAAERERIERELEARAGVLAGSMAEKLLRRLPERETTAAMFAALLDRLRAMPEPERRKLAAEGTLTLVTPAAPGEADRVRYADALRQLLPDMTPPEFAADPALVAGFELRGPHTIVRNSWRADLDGLIARLNEEEGSRAALA